MYSFAAPHIFLFNPWRVLNPFRSKYSDKQKQEIFEYYWDQRKLYHLCLCSRNDMTTFHSCVIVYRLTYRTHLYSPILYIQVLYTLYIHSPLSYTVLYSYTLPILYYIGTMSDLKSHAAVVSFRLDGHKSHTHSFFNKEGWRPAVFSNLPAAGSSIMPDNDLKVCICV